MFFDRQVSVWELLWLCLVSFLALIIGNSLPLMIGIAIIGLPLLIAQLLFEGLIIGLWYGAKRLIWGKTQAQLEPPPAPRPPRHGVAKWLWYLPFLAIVAGFLIQRIDTGTWFF